MSLHKSTIKSILYATMRCLLAIGVLFSSHHVYAQNSEAKKIQPKPFKKAVLMRARKQQQKGLGESIRQFTLFDDPPSSE